ncbi:MAG TPA: DUF2279 domain-containing protein [Hanamia sp.]|nr:DUF2279 domain-containing protein [Hanamia sp.]
MKTRVKNLLMCNRNKKTGRKYSLLLFVWIICIYTVNAQPFHEQGFLTASSNFNRQRFTVAVASEAAIGALTTFGLQYLWYRKYNHSRFHFFNDNDEWLQMDKLGHATTAYNICAIQYNVMRWAGVKKVASLWTGVGTALAFMSMIEISDGFSSNWGFSPGDMLANSSGIGLFSVQQYTWQQQKIFLQYSYHSTLFPNYNPGELGSDLPERMLKDYNGQSYWLSFSVSSFLKTSRFPNWVNADIGYGATGMTAAVTNPSEINGQKIPSFDRERKLFFSISPTFTANNNITYPSWINVFKVPAPALEYNLSERKMKVDALYY